MDTLSTYDIYRTVVKGVFAPFRTVFRGPHKVFLRENEALIIRDNPVKYFQRGVYSSFSLEFVLTGKCQVSR